VQGLDPLAVFDIALSTWNPLDGARTDQTTLKAERFEVFKDGDPVDAGAFHGDRSDLVFLQPVPDGVQVSSVSSKQTDDFGVGLLAWDTDPDFMRTNIHASSMGLDAADTSEGLRVGDQNRLCDGGT
jgi:hypothetical protein